MLEERMINLEIKFSHQERLVDELNLIVTEQQMLLEKLKKDLLEAKQTLSELTPQTPRSLKDEVPPHY